MTKIAILLIAGILVFALLPFALQPALAQTPAPPTHPKASTEPKPSAHKPGAPSGISYSYDRTLLRPSLLKDKAPDTYQVKFTTTRGDFIVTVTRAWAPNGADRFYNLAKHHFFDNTSFFRVLNGFIAQFGLSAYPPVSTVWQTATIKDDPVTQSNKKGTVTFATAGPNTRTTQLFINLGDNAALDSRGFAPFGQVTEGMDVVQSLYSGYGEGAPQGSGPDQERINKEGKPYLDQGWPKLDSIKTTTLILPPGSSSSPAKTAPAHKPMPPAHKPQ
jgi:peptidyl-prolyl cis-trans isomerase A (cyclophilin A)